MNRQHKTHSEKVVTLRRMVTPVEIVPTEGVTWMHGIRVLHAEDDDLLRELCRRALAHAGCAVVSVADGVDAWLAVQKQDFDLIITDHEMPHCTGYELISKLRHQHIHWPVIVTTGEPGAFRGGATDWLDLAAVIAKPFGFRELTSAVAQAVWGNNVILEPH